MATGLTGPGGGGGANCGMNLDPGVLGVPGSPCNHTNRVR